MTKTLLLTRMHGHAHSSRILQRLESKMQNDYLHQQITLFQFRLLRLLTIVATLIS